MLVTSTTVIQTAVDFNTEQSGNFGVTRAYFTLKDESPTNAIFVHDIPSQYTADPDMTADDLAADDSNADEDNEDQCVQPTMECCVSSSKSGTL